MNALRVVQGPVHDAPLSARGRAQAAALAERFRGVPLRAVLASPLARARATAEALAGATGAPLRVDARLVEFHWGEFCGRAQSGDDGRAMTEYVTRWGAGEHDLAPPGGESPALACARLEPVRALLGRLASPPDTVADDEAGDGRPRADSSEAVAVVAHGRLNKILLSLLVHGSVSRMEEFPQSNTGVTTIEGPFPRWRVLARDDVAHLQTDGLLPGDARPETA